MTGWQPIQSAPKDGRWIFVHCGPNMLLTAYPVFWNGQEWDDGVPGEIDGNYAMATHWMWPPDPPRAHGEGMLEKTK